MGANFCWARLKCSRSELPAKFKAFQDRERVEYGAGPYQGHLGIKNGLHIDKRTATSEAEAEGWCLDDDKWGPARAILVKHADPPDEHWFIGGWCSS